MIKVDNDFIKSQNQFNKTAKKNILCLLDVLAKNQTFGTHFVRLFFTLYFKMSCKHLILFQSI